MRPEHAYLLGFVQTDGHHEAGPGRKGRVRVEVSAVDAPLLHAFVELVRPAYSSVSYRDRTTNFGEHRTVSWAAYDESLRAEFLALGLPTGKKSTTVAPPSVPFSSRDYLRGLLDGDGSVGFTGKGLPFVSFVTASQALAEFFCAQVEAVTGARRAPRRTTRDGVFAPMVTNDPAAALAAYLYAEDCLALPRKAQSAARVAAWTRPKGMRARPAVKRAWTPEEDQVVLSTTSIREVAAQLGRSERAVNQRRWRLRTASA